MMTSALYGHPPKTEDDLWLVKGLMGLFQVPAGKLDPSKGFPLRVHPPPDYQLEDRCSREIASVSVVIVLVILITGNRLALRYFRRRLRWGPDDWVIIPATIGTIAWMALTIPMVTKGGSGRHLWDITYMEYWWYFRIGGLKQLIFWMTSGLIKISITLFNRRLTGLTSERWVYAHNAFLILVVFYTIIALFLNVFHCKPAAVQYDLIKWGQQKDPVRCLSSRIISDTLITFHVVFDFALLSVPLIILYKIQMNTSRKIRLAFLFSVGSLSCIGSAMRLHIEAQASPDRTWAYAKQLNWSIVDLFFGITAASLPVLDSALPKRWRSPPTNGQTFDTIPALDIGEKRSSARPYSKEPSPNRGRSREQLELKTYSNDTLHAHEKRLTRDPSVSRPVEWTDPAEELQHPVPTHRDRLWRRSSTDDDPV